MTDKEIIKALECCAEGFKCRSTCPYYDDQDEIYDCTSRLSKDALYLINHRERQIDRWMEECGKQSVLWQRYFDNIFKSAMRTTKAEAIKEFAERLKEKYQDSKYVVVDSYYSRTCNNVVEHCIKQIDAVKKEMTEGQK